MSIHPSLKSKSGALNQHRNVLTRTERIAKLTELALFDNAKNSALCLPKVRSIKAAVAKKPKKDPAAAGADAAKADAKGGAKPAAGAKAPAGAKAGGDKKK